MERLLLGCKRDLGQRGSSGRGGRTLPAVTTHPGQSATVEDLYRFPDDGRRYELVAGTVVSEPLPGFRHGRVVARIVSRLRAFAEAQGLGEVVTADTGFVLARGPDTLRGPDVAFVAKGRLPSATEESRAFEGPPDLAVEVVSPSNRPEEIRAKVADYLAAGSRLVWVVDPDPERRTITVYESLLAPRVLGADEEVGGADVLPGFRSQVSELL